MDEVPARRAADLAAPRVLAVTGAWYPELSGGGLQMRAVARALAAHARFSVLTTTTDPARAGEDDEGGLRVTRVHVRPGRVGSEMAAAFRIAHALRSLRRIADVVHVHGFSRKTVVLQALARAARTPLVLTLTTAGEDDPAHPRPGAAQWAYGQAAAYVGVSPRFERLYAASRLPRGRFHLIPNAVDVERFRPAGAPERDALAARLGLPAGLPRVLYVGLFTRDKRPHALAEAWLRGQGRAPSTLVLVGASAAGPGVDPTLARAIRERAAAAGAADRVVFVERTLEPEAYFRACHAFAMPSVREGLPNALLEAMACGLPCVAARLPGVTDWMLGDRAGLLVPPDDAEALAEALVAALGPGATALGTAARATAVARFSLGESARLHLGLYRELTARAS